MNKSKIINALTFLFLIINLITLGNCSFLKNDSQNMFSDRNYNESKKQFFESNNKRLLKLDIDYSKRRLASNSENFFNEISSNISSLSGNLIIKNKQNNYTILGSSDFGFYIYELNSAGEKIMHNGFQDNFGSKLFPKTILSQTNGYSIIGNSGSNTKKIFILNTDLKGQIHSSSNLESIYSDFSGTAISLFNNDILLVASLKDMQSSKYDLGLITIPYNGGPNIINLWGSSASLSPKFIIDCNDNSHAIIFGDKQLLNKNSFSTKVNYIDNDIIWTKIYLNKNEYNANSLKITNDKGYLSTGYSKDSNSKNGAIMKNDDNGELDWYIELKEKGNSIFYDSLNINNQHLFLGFSDSYTSENSLILIALNEKGYKIEGYNKVLPDLDYKIDKMSFIEEDGEIMIILSSQENAHNFKISSNFSILPHPFLDINPNIKDLTKKIFVKKNYLQKEEVDSFLEENGEIINFNFKITNKKFIFQNNSYINPFITDDNNSISIGNNSAGSSNLDDTEEISIFYTPSGEIIMGIIIGGILFLICCLFCFMFKKIKRKINKVKTNKKFIEFANIMNNNKSNINEEYSTSEQRPLTSNIVEDISNSVNSINNSSSRTKTSDQTTESSSLIDKNKVKKIDFTSLSQQDFIGIPDKLLPISLQNINNKIENDDLKTDKSSSSSKKFKDVKTIMKINVPPSPFSDDNNENENENNSTQSTENNSNSESSSLIKKVNNQKI